MKELLEGLSKMFFDLQIVTSIDNENPVLVFAAACAIFGALAVALDFTLFFLRGQSLLKLKHGKNTFFFLVGMVIWSFGDWLVRANVKGICCQSISFCCRWFYVASHLHKDFRR